MRLTTLMPAHAPYMLHKNPPRMCSTTLIPPTPPPVLPPLPSPCRSQMPPVQQPPRPASWIDGVLPDATIHTLCAMRSASCALDIQKTTATRDFDNTRAAGEVTVALLGVIGKLKSKELPIEKIGLSYERGSATTLDGTQIGAFGAGYFQVVAPEPLIAAIIGDRALPVFNAVMEDGKTAYRLQPVSLNTESMTIKTKTRDENVFHLDARGELLPAFLNGSLEPTLRQHIMPAGIRLDSLERTKDPTTGAFTNRLRAEFQLTESFWAPRLRNVKFLRFGQGMASQVALEFGSKFLQSHRLHTCLGILKGETYRNAGANLYCACDAEGSLRGAANAISQGEKRRRIEGYQSRKMAKQRAGHADAFFD